MSWILGSTTIPEPKVFKRQNIEKSVFHEMVNGTTKRDVTSRRERFFLGYTRIDQGTVASILAEWSQRSSLVFSAESGELSIAEREVHVILPDREYNTKGGEFREDFELILEDVDGSL